jgi:hypothetical protein
MYLWLQIGFSVVSRSSFVESRTFIIGAYQGNLTLGSGAQLFNSGTFRADKNAYERSNQDRNGLKN